MLKDDNGATGRNAWRVGEVLQRLDEIAKEAGSGLHPRLRHFLENRSYEKALLWLEDGEPEKAFAEDEPEQRTKGRKRPVTAAENFGDSPFSALDSIGLPETAPGFPKRQANRGSQRLKNGWAVENDWRSEGKKRSRGKDRYHHSRIPPRVNSKMRMSLLKRMKTSLGTGGTWNGSCMELQGDKSRRLSIGCPLWGSSPFWREDDPQLKLSWRLAFPLLRTDSSESFWSLLCSDSRSHDLPMVLGS